MRIQTKLSFVIVNVLMQTHRYDHLHVLQCLYQLWVRIGHKLQVCQRLVTRMVHLFQCGQELLPRLGHQLQLPQRDQELLHHHTHQVRVV